MKKSLSLIAVCALLFCSSNQSHASPVQKHDQSSISETVVLNDMAVPIVLNHAYMVEDVKFIPVVTPASDPASTIQKPATVILNKDPLAGDERMWLYRHYFDPEDNKRYPEYRPDKLSDGFPLPVDRPAR